MGCVLSCYTSRQLNLCTVQTVDKYPSFDFQGVYDVKVVEILTPTTFRGVMYFQDRIYQFRYTLLNCESPSSNPNDIPYIIAKSKLMAKLPLDKMVTCVCLRNAYTNNHLSVTVHLDPDGTEHLTVNDWMNKYEYTKPTNGRRRYFVRPPPLHCPPAPPIVPRGNTRLNTLRPPPLRPVQSPLPPPLSSDSSTPIPSFSSAPSTPPSAPPLKTYTRPDVWLPRSRSAVALTTLKTSTDTLNSDWDFVEE